MKNEKTLLLIFAAIFLMSFALAVSPSGAIVTFEDSTRALEDAAGSDDAIAGNVTELTVFGYSTTQSWQGYFGNITGTIQLANSNDDVMYNWSSAVPEGEIYASNSSSLAWANIACFDLTNDHAALEASFGIASSDYDGVNETFTLNDHALFYSNNVEFTSGECNNTKIYDDTGSGAFDEVLMTDGTNTIYASLIQDDGTGFDAATHDFEMIVLEDGHGTDTSITTYYFWVELE